ncbi:MAG: hypothetical protein U0793_14545 [Gemmataceae bacterium]
MSRVLPLLLLWLCAGCSREASYRAVVEEQIAAWKEMTQLLETVKDQPSMEAARARLQALSARYGSIAERARKLGRPGPEIQESLQGEIERLGLVLREARREMSRIRDLPGGVAFLEELDGLSPK